MARGLLGPLVLPLVLLAGCGEEAGAPGGTAGGGGGGGGPDDDVCRAKPDHKPISIWGGDRTMLAVMDDGTLYCWRENGTGQCDIEEFGVLFSWPRRVPNLPCVTKAAAGNVGIAMTANGEAYTWGIETNDERGDGDGPSPPSTVPTRLRLEGVVDVAGSGRAMGAVAGDGQAYWWGQTARRASTPEPVGSAGMANISVNSAVSCLRSRAGAVACWGSDHYGALGPGQRSTEIPVLIDLGFEPGVLAVEHQTACVLFDEEVFCWGDNGYGLLARGEPEENRPPSDPEEAPIASPGPFAGIAMGDGTACAWRPNGEVLCWGDNYIGLYAPVDGTPTSVPRRVSELEPAKQVAVVYDEVCALGFDDQVRCRDHEPDPVRQQPPRVLDFNHPPPQPR